MSVRNVQDQEINAVRRTLVEPLAPYVRNPSWPTIAWPSDHYVRGLYAVWPNQDNFFAVSFTTSTGQYTVDTGDGTTTNVNSGTQFNYNYSYSDPDLANTDAPVTITASTDLISRTAHGYSNDMEVRFYNLSGGAGLTEGQVYYVVNANANNFQVSATVRGSPINITSDGTATLLPYKIAVVQIYPVTGGATFTVATVNALHNQTGLTTNYSCQWLDIKANIPAAAFDFTASNVRVRSLRELRTRSTTFSVATRAEFLAQADVEITTNSNFTLDATFDNCANLQYLTLKITGTGVPTSCNGTFTSCRRLKSVPPFNTASVTNMSSMFANCFSLTTVPLFNTANVTNMSNMFQGCSSLTTVPLFNTASVTNMASMFQTCSALTTVPLFNTVSVTSMASMFASCASLQSVPLFNTANVTTMSGMFNGCSSLTTVPLFNTASVTTMSTMFQGCSALTTVPLFNTVNVTSMASMFASCASLQSVPLFNTASVTTMSSMFQSCQALRELPALNLNGVSSSANMNNWVNNDVLFRIRATGARFTHTIANNCLSGTNLDEYYTGLPTITAQTLTVTGNYGTTTDTPSIATGKGWTVTGS